MSDVIAMACGCQGRFKCNYHQGIDEGREQERARIIAMMLAEADALAGRVDSDITTYSGAVALRRLAELLGKDVLLLGIADLIESEVTK